MGRSHRTIDTLRQRVSVQENAVMVGTVIHVGIPKPHATRSVPYSKFPALPLVKLFEEKSREDLDFGDGLLHNRSMKESGAENIHGCRASRHTTSNTAASLAISASSNVKAVQRMLGHASASMTLDTYTDLFDDDLDAVAATRATSTIRRINQ